MLAFLDTGAYQDASASNFNALPRPGTALVCRRLGGDDPPPRDDRGRLRARRDPGAAARGRRGRGADGVARHRTRPRLGDQRRPRPLARRSTATCSASRCGRAGTARGAERVRDHRVHGRHASAGPTSSCPHGQVLELIEYVDPRGTPSRPARRTIRERPTSRCGSADIDAIHARLRDAGVPVRSEPGRAHRARRLAGRAMLLRQRSRRRHGGADPAVDASRRAPSGSPAPPAAWAPRTRGASPRSATGSAAGTSRPRRSPGSSSEIRGAGGEAEAVGRRHHRLGGGRGRRRRGCARRSARPTVVVANAGILLSGEHIADLDPAAWRRVIDVNLTGAFLTAKAAIPQLREAGGGSMVLISSICGLTASSGYGAYNASKHGVIGLMRTLAHELRVRRGQRQRDLPGLGPDADVRPIGRRGGRAGRGHRRLRPHAP